MSSSSSVEASTDAALARRTGDSDAGSRRQISILLYSDNRTTRDTVRLGVGSTPSPEVTVERWVECATPDAAQTLVAEGAFDLLILDGEAQPYGGMGLCRQFKDELFDCPPVLVLIGRKEDGWLAAWSLADGVVPHPHDPTALAEAVTALTRV